MEQRDGNYYLTMYPKLRQWINQCAACQAQGYKPEMPGDIYAGVAAQNLRRYFRSLEVNELGFCEQCQAALESIKNSD